MGRHTQTDGLRHGDANETDLLFDMTIAMVLMTPDVATYSYLVPKDALESDYLSDREFFSTGYLEIVPTLD